LLDVAQVGKWAHSAPLWPAGVNLRCAAQPECGTETGFAYWKAAARAWTV